MLEKIGHIGIAVQSLEKTLPFYTDILNLELLGIEEVGSQQVKVAFLEIGESKLELLEPLSKESPVARFIEKHGEGVHHIAFETMVLEKRIQYMKERGIQFINKVPKLGAEGAKIAFIHPNSSYGTLYELCEKGGDPN